MSRSAHHFNMHYTYGTDIQMTSEVDDEQTITMTGYDVDFPLFDTGNIIHRMGRGPREDGGQLQTIEVTIRGGTIYLPRSASEENIWTNYSIPDKLLLARHKGRGKMSDRDKKTIKCDAGVTGMCKENSGES